MKYKKLIYTNHILQRMKERGLSYDYVYWVWNRPDKRTDGKAEGSYKFFRKLKDEWLVVVAKKNELGEWILLTCWTKPMYPEKQPYRRTKPNWLWRLIKWLWKKLTL